ncbi:MAG: DUF3147 family protein [Candidatus Acidiferrales bacterium]
MRISFDLTELKKTTWREYAIRFLFGGAVTVMAGVLAKLYGPAFGGLFLAFPAIFPASATLLEKHEREKKQAAGISRTIRGRQAAALDARGAAMGSVGLEVFALIVWKLLPRWNGACVLIAALAGWFAVSFLTWRLRRHRAFFWTKSV